MIPLSDGIPAKRFPFVNIGLIAANFIVWIFYELPHLDSSVLHAADIDVKADDGTVTLSGLVEFARSRDRAERVALGVAGVAQVHNRLKVLVPVSPDDVPRRPSISAGDRPARRGV